MYIPKMFREDDRALIHPFMREHSFASLVTNGNGRPFASHLPLLLDETRGEHGSLYGHMAHANPQWQEFEPAQEVLAIFQGPHAYVSPSWYEEPLSVPTWNYVAVHAYGLPRVISDPVEVLELMTRLVDTYEAAFPRPWKLELPEAYLTRLLHGIVAFEIRITRLEGKAKISQNRTGKERETVAARLEQSGDAAAVEVSEWMKRLANTR